MFFEGERLTVVISSVHLLSWKSRNVVIPPKESYALSFRQRGSSSFLTDGYTVSATDGDIMYFPKGVGYKLSAGEERLYAVNFEIVGEDAAPLSRILSFRVEQSERFAELFFRLYSVWSSREEGYYHRAVSIFHRIIAEMVREGTERKSDSGYKRLKPALELVNSSYTSPELTVRSVAEHISVSEVYLRRLFARYTSMSPVEYINERRIAYAKELLESGFYGVCDVSSMCGYTDSKYFSTTFKRRTGVSPSEYKKRYTR